MISRITTSQLLATSQGSLGASKAQLARLQQQLTSGSTLTKPSDDPGATAAALRVHNEQRVAAQYGRNIDDGLGWLGTIQDKLGSASSQVIRVRDLTLQGLNAGNNTESHGALAA